MSSKIESRYGAEVYVSQTGWVCIKQDSPGYGEQIITLHREEVPELIEHLQREYQKALDFVPEPDTEADDA
jgi:hypothetical protein